LASAFCDWFLNTVKYLKEKLLYLAVCIDFFIIYVGTEK
jgi:hypothetical protein